MDENTSLTTEGVPGTGGADEAADAAELLAGMRRRVDAAAEDIERLTAELAERTQALDELEAVADAVLGAADTPIVVVGADRRLRAVTRGAAELLGVDGPVLGRPLSTVVPDDVVEATRERLDRIVEEPGIEAETVAAGEWKVTVEGLGDGGALLVLHRT